MCRVGPLDAGEVLDHAFGSETAKSALASDKDCLNPDVFRRWQHTMSQNFSDGRTGQSWSENEDAFGENWKKPWTVGNALPVVELPVKKSELGLNREVWTQKTRLRPQALVEIFCPV